MKTLAIASLAAAASAAAYAAAPAVSVTGFSQGADRTITVSYTLSGEPAVITLDIETNSSSWASIGGKDLCRAQGDVWKLVDEGTGTITWRPSGDAILPLFAAGDVRAVVTAWPTNDPPAYMVVDLTVNSSARLTYYQSEDFVPGGVLSNTDYRISKMLMRKIPAAGVTWTMGSLNEAGRVAAAETQHTVTLSENYYLDCFPLTQAQAQLVTTQTPANLGTFTVEGAMRSCDKISYFYARENTYNVNSANASYQYPNPPHPWSFLGRLRARTGDLVEFDLPTEAQWEYACRAGTGEGHWNDGGLIGTDPMPGRYSSNGGVAARTNSSWPPAFDTSRGPTNGVAAAGMYNPNAWGLYDMHGNALEWCLDWYADDITSLNGAVNISSTDGAKLADGVTAGSKRVRRGGYFLSGENDCRSAYRGYGDAGTLNNAWDTIRPAAPAVAK